MAADPKFVQDERVTPALVYWLKKGMQLNTAALKAGVRAKDLESWLEKGRREDAKEPYASFAEEIEQALASYEAFLCGILHESVEREERPDLTTARWMLERRFPKRWRSKEPVDEIVPVRADGRAYSAEELRTAAELLEGAAARQKARLEAERKSAS